MSIDGEIAKYKEITNTECLEELEELRATSCGYSKEDIELNRNARYNKAIDDFAEAFDNWIKSDTKRTYYWTEFQVEFMKIAERLKEGVNNET